MKKLRIKFFYRIKKLISLYQEYKSSKFNWYRVENIDAISDKVDVAIRGKSGILHLSMYDVIYNESILYNVSPIDTSLIGYAYSIREKKVPKQETGQKQQNFDFLLKISNGSLKVLNQTRNSELTYIDVHSSQIYQKNPLEIMNDKNLLLKFGSGQSCYIGILAGIYDAKKITAKENIKPELRLVK